jgi:cap1 methyltransferase
MDSMFDFMFTNPVDEMGNSLVGENDLLYFADVCAGELEAGKLQGSTS